MTLLFHVLLVLNALWFGSAFVYFGVVPVTAAKIRVPRALRDSPLFVTLAASIRCLGGMNLALSVFALFLLGAPRLFPDPRQAAVFCGVFGLAHATQLLFNIPVLLAERGEARASGALWPVTRAPMLFIFVVDGTLAAANLLLSAALVSA